MTGNNPIKGKGLYENEEYEYEPQFKIILLCNDMLDIDSNDEGICARMRCIEFPIKFVDNPTADNEKQIDKGLQNKIKMWKQDFMLLLLEYYKKYKTDGLTNKIKKYQKESDIYFSYLDERTESSNKNIHTKKLHEDFCEWYNNKFGSINTPSNRTFIREIKKYKNVKKVNVEGYTTSGIEKLGIKVK
jgi:phage/plasmid-associated DNA primase